ncbi:hypothetical protein OXPF_41430 [Oxobacter pfennigii]|uniref:Inhibitor of sigma-G Gin n=1 Tax=Oxobacter pfennigii TaxID=36849 RepID=A0A0P8W4F3_9CLOT|nr:hypothetical protein [Oxobacter pfennigii]KPU42358.1 hypothetical protein OXPF_41430 [Oxobacter pfennigii]
MNCSKCNAEIPEGEEQVYLHRIVCEDCYVRETEPPKACDVPRERSIN